MSGFAASGLDGTWLVPGDLDGDIIVLDEPLSFWGGFNAKTGQIIDRAHPQHGVRISGKIVAMPGSKGSSGTPGVLGESIRLGTGPAGMVITKADMNLVAGAITAAALYGASCPIMLVSEAQFEELIEGMNET